MGELTNNDILHKFHPKLRKFITEIWNNRRIGKISEFGRKFTLTVTGYVTF